MITEAHLNERLEAWARWCVNGRFGVLGGQGYPPQSPEQSANTGGKAVGIITSFDREAEVESVIACIAARSLIHARVLRVEYGAARDCGWAIDYDRSLQHRNARRVGISLSRYKQLLREARGQVAVGLMLSRRCA